jgi:tetratricopeptide (TPR) repeat protein
LGSAEGPHFASVAEGLRGYKARHLLAMIYQKMGRLAEAEAQWRAAVADRLDFIPAWAGLGELYLAQNRQRDLEELNNILQTTGLPSLQNLAVGLRGRGFPVDLV